MADSSVVHVGQNSPEYVALKLLEMVARVEKRTFYHSQDMRNETTADRAYLLDTYAECLEAVRGQRITKS